MKKSLIILLLGLTLVLSSCNKDIPTDTENTTEASQIISYSVYCSPTASDIKLDGKSENIKISDASEKTFSFASKIPLEKLDEIDDTHIFNIADKEYDLSYSRTYKTQLSSSDKFKKFSEFVTFRNDDVSIDYRTDDGIITLFLNPNCAGNAESISESLTKEEISKLAESIVTELYGEEVLNKYVTEGVRMEENQWFKGYVVSYCKYVHGIETKDSIQLTFGLDGELISINALMFGVYDTAEEDLTLEEISNAKNALNESLGNNFKIMQIYLIVDSLGDYYLDALTYGRTASADSETELMGLELFVNIQ